MREVDPDKTQRSMSYQLYIDAPMPMVTLFRTLDVSRLIRLRRRGYSFNMLMCYCILSAAGAIPEFSLLPVGKKLMAYDTLAVSAIIANRAGGISSCDIPACPDLPSFDRAYRDLTGRVRDTCENHDLPDSMVIGTSCLAKYDLDGAVNFYSGLFNNPFLIWGRYRRRGLRTWLRVSFQFHHVQMDGEQACRFLDELQSAIRRLDT